MKAGIITFHAAHNNGSMLQAYALQQVLEKKFKLDTEIIDYSGPGQRRQYALFRKVSKPIDLILNIIKFFNYRLFIRHYEDYNLFLAKYFKLSKGNYASIEQLEEVEQDYDVFIAGSDQIWNFDCGDVTDAYFLSFIKHKPRLAYAVSLGATDFRQIKGWEKYRDLIKRFQSLSVRENNGARWVSEAVNRNVEVCLDPTVLLDEEEWLKLIEREKPATQRELYKLIGKPDDLSKGYIFYYCFRYFDYGNKFVRQISKRYGLPVVVLNVKSYFKSPSMWRFNLVRDGGPLVFLSIVKNATLCINNSFHGSAFSMLFKKKFWFITGRLNNPQDDRVKTLMDKLGIKNRIIQLPDDASIDVMQEVGYEDFEKLLAAEREKSFNYLEKSLEECSSSNTLD